MKQLFGIILLSVLSITAKAQSATDSTSNQNFKVSTDREAMFPGGDKELLMYVYKNAPYSEEAKAAYAEGTVLVSFFVNTDSTLSNFIVLSDTEPKCGPAVVEIMKSLKYIPAVQNGVAVRRQKMVSLTVRAH